MDEFENVQITPLLVTGMMIQSPAAETCSVYPKQKKYIDISQVKQLRIYKRLMAKNRIFPDLATEIVYQNPTHPIKSVYVATGVNCDEVEITPKYTVDVPKCCNFHNKEMHQNIKQYRKYLYNSSEPSRFPYRKAPTRLEHVIKKSLQTNSRLQMPLSTVCVHWHNSRHFTPNSQHIQRSLQKYGPISRVVMTSDETANVVFDNLVDSCKVIEAKVVDGDTGLEKERLFCHWMHKTLQATKFVSTGVRLRGVHDEFIYPKIYDQDR